MKLIKKAQFVFSFFTILLLAGQAQAGTFLSLGPGEAAVKEFELYDVFDAAALRPMATYVVLGKGDNETKLGDLTLTVKPTATKSYGSVVDYSVIGLAIPFGGGAPAFVSGNATAPLELKKVVKVTKSTYALVLLGVYIKDITGDVDRPVLFSINFSWAAAK